MGSIPVGATKAALRKLGGFFVVSKCNLLTTLFDFQTLNIWISDCYSLFRFFTGFDSAALIA